MCTVLIRTSSKHRKQTSAYKRICAYTRYAPNNARVRYAVSSDKMATPSATYGATDCELVEELQEGSFDCPVCL